LFENAKIVFIALVAEELGGIHFHKKGGNKMKNRKNRAERNRTIQTIIYKLGTSLLVVCFLAVLVTFGFIAGPAEAADKFFRTDGMKGDSLDTDHLNWSDLTAYTNVFNPNEEELCTVVIDKVIDSISPKLWHRALGDRRGDPWPLENAEIELVDPSTRRIQLNVKMPLATIKKIAYTDSSEVNEFMLEPINRDRIVLIPTRITATFYGYDENGNPLPVENTIECDEKK
jgi:hypothetical protein